MNKIYRVVWNAELGQWVVASEVAKGRKKKASTASGIAVLTLAAMGGGMAVSTEAIAANPSSAYLDLCYGTGQAFTYQYQSIGVGCNGTYSFDLGLGDGYGGYKGWVSLRSQDNYQLQLHGVGGVSIMDTLTMNNLKITNLQAGTSTTDAVTLGQLKAVEAKIPTSGGTGTDPLAVHYNDSAKAVATLGGTSGTKLTNVADGNVAFGSKDAVTGGQLFTTNQNVTNVQNAVNNITNGGGIRYFHANSGSADSTATGSESIAIGGGAKAVGTTSIAMGNNAQNVTGANNSIAVGGNAKSSDLSVTIGNNADTSTQAWSTALGTNTRVTGSLGTALGAAATVTGSNSAAIGANSVADRANTVSVGNSGAQRQIVQLARGTADYDAVNVSQLKGVTTAIGGGSAVNADGTIKAPVYTVQGAMVNDVGTAVGRLDTATTKNTGDISTLNTTVNNIKTGGDNKYFHANSTRADAAATGYEAIAIGGGTQALGTETIVLGKDSKATADATYSVVVGSGSVADRASTVSVGRSDYQRQIVNMAKGTADTDAVNVSQLKGVAAAIGGGSAVNSDGTVKAPTYTVNGTPYSNVGAAINAIATSPGNADAVKWNAAAGAYDAAHGATATSKIVNVADGSIASGSKDAVNGGQLYTTNQNVTDVQNTVNSITNGAGIKYFHVNSSIADSSAAGSDSVAIGPAASVAAGSMNSIAIGRSASVSAAATTTGIAIGTGAKSTATDGIAFGRDAAASVTDGVALGHAALANRASGLGGSTKGAISVGSGGAVTATDTRQIISVARGTQDTDATNLSQLKGVTAVLGGNSAITADGTIKAPDYNIAGKTYNTVGAALDALSQGTSPQLKYIKFGATAAQDAFAAGSDSVAIGGASYANGDRTVAIGTNANAVADSVAIGFGSYASKSGTFAVGGELPNQYRRIVHVADGIENSDAATVGQLNAKFSEAVQAASVPTVKTTLKSSGLLGATLTTTDLLKAGTTNMRGASVIGTDNVSIGLETAAANNRTVAFGVATTAIAEESVAMGQSATANAWQAVAIGTQVQAYGANSLAMGTGGTQVTDSGTRSTAIGYRAVVGGVDTVALGNMIASEGSNNVVLGNKSGDANRTSVASVGSKGAERQVIFVKAGTADTDAVNVSQLKSVATAIGGGSKVGTDGMVTLPTYKIAGVDTTGTLADGISKLDEKVSALPVPAEALLWDGTNSVYSAKHAGTNAKVTNMAAGTIGDASTDAINGSQLHATNKAVSDIIGGTGAGLNTDGTIKPPTFTVGDETQNTVADAIAKLDGIVDDAVVYDKDSAKAKVTFGGTTFNSTDNTGGTTLTNVAVGKADSDAVNLKQLKDAGLFKETGEALNAVVYDSAAKTQVTFNSGAAATKLANVAAGTISDASTDAINGSQLHATNKALSDVLGGKDGGLNTDGSVKTPTFDVAGKNYATVGEAITAAAQGGLVDALKWDTNAYSAKHDGANAKITNLAMGAVSGSSTDAINGSQLFNTANSLAFALGGGAKVDPTTGEISKPSYTVNGTPTLGVDAAIAALNGKVSDSLQWDSVVGAYTASHTGSQTNRIINVADGVNPTDAVNKSQLDVITNGLAPQLKFIKFGYSDAKDAFANGTDSVAIGGASVANGDKALAIGTKANAVADSVAIGFGSAATEAGTFAVGGILSKQYRRVVHVADGIEDSDAATVGQLNAKFDEVVHATSAPTVKATLKSSGLLGATLTTTDLLKAGTTNMRGASVIGTDNVSIGLETAAANNRTVAFGVATTAIAEESVAMGQSATANAWQAVAIGSQVQAYGANSLAMGTGGTQVTDSGTRSTAIGYRAVVGGVDTVALGNMIASEGSNNVVLGNKSGDANRTFVASVGSKGAERQVIFVKAGSADTDAVNVGQLKVVTAALGGEAAVNADGSVKAPTYTLDGKTYATVGDALVGINAKVSPSPTLGVIYDGDTKESVTLGGADGTTIGNLAAGAKDDQAVNVAQLKGVADLIGGGAGIDEDGKITAPEFLVTKSDGTEGKFDNVGDAITTIDGRVTTVDNRVTQIANNYSTLSGDVLKWNGEAGDAGAYTAAHGTQATSRITNVAAGTADNDAVNKKQLTDAIAGINPNNPLAVSYDTNEKDVLTLGGTNGDGTPANAPVKLTNVAAATGNTDAVNLGQLKEAGLFDPDGKALDAVVYDADSAKGFVTFGGANGTILNNVADGLINEGSRQAVNGGQLFKLQGEIKEQITHIDNRVTKIEKDGTGRADYISVNPQAAALEKPAPANAGTTAGIAVGYSASASGEGASAMGDHAVAQAKDATAIGNGSTVTESATNSVALGNNSVADTANTVSIGSAGNERTISHLARGNADTDAATMGQVRESLDEAKAYTDSQLNDVWQNVGEQIDEVNRQANRGIAAASALVNVTPYVPGHTAVNAGMASYRGETALGIGVSRWSENGRVNLNAGVSAAKDDEPVFRVGIGYIF